MFKTRIYNRHHDIHPETGQKNPLGFLSLLSNSKNKENKKASENYLMDNLLIVAEQQMQ